MAEIQYQNILSPRLANNLFENMSDGVIVVDSKGVITYINSAGEHVFGVKLENIAGKLFTDVFAQNKKNKEFNALVENSMLNGVPTEKEQMEYRTVDGRKLNLSVDVSLVAEHHVFKKTPFKGMMVLVEDETVKFKLRRQEKDCAYIIAGLLTCITAYLSLWTLLRFTLRRPYSTDFYTTLIESISFILFLEIITCTSFRLRDIGLVFNFSRIKRNLIETLSIGLVASGLLVLLRGAQVFFEMGGKDYFIGGTMQGFFTYFITAFTQEFLARGVMQTSVKIVMQVKWQRPLSIFLTSLLFALMHIPFGFVFMCGAFFLSIGLGIVFDVQKDLWGCVLLHWVVGYLAMCLFF